MPAAAGTADSGRSRGKPLDNSALSQLATIGVSAILYRVAGQPVVLWRDPIAQETFPSSSTGECREALAGAER
jgi:hypothetical protein